MCAIKRLRGAMPEIGCELFCVQPHDDAYKVEYLHKLNARNCDVRPKLWVNLHVNAQKDRCKVYSLCTQIKG